jgi:5S rRNA maturation endonuclease (ribonuclease M5)
MKWPPEFLEQIKQALPVINVVQARHKMRKDGANEYRAVDDNSLTVNTAKNVWNDFGKDEGGDIFAFERYATGCGFNEAVERLADMAGLPLPAGKTRMRSNGHAGASSSGAAIHHDYVDLDEALNYQVIRKADKSGFLQRRPHGPMVNGKPQGGWIWGLTAGEYIRKRNGDFVRATTKNIEKHKGGERIECEDCPDLLYRWPQLREELVQDSAERRDIYICEGEKDVLTLVAWGCCATTNSGGAANWQVEHTEEFRGRDANVIVLEDNDQAGRKHTNKIASSLVGVARPRQNAHQHQSPGGITWFDAEVVRVTDPGIA